MRVCGVCLIATLCLLGASVAAQPEVSGRVTSESGDGLAGALVELLPPAGEAQPVVTSRTDLAGRFRIRAPLRGVWQIRALSEGRVPMVYSPLVLVEAAEIAPVALWPLSDLPAGAIGEAAQERGSTYVGIHHLQSGWRRATLSGAGGEVGQSQASSGEVRKPAGDVQRGGTATIVGTIHAEGGAPVAGCLVWSPTDPGSFVLSDVDGRYRIAVPVPGRMWLQADAAGYSPRGQWIRPDRLRDGRAPTLELPRGVALEGVVRDAEGHSVANATVTAVARRERRGREFSRPDQADGRAVSGPEGRFLLRGLEAGTRHEVRVEHRGFTPRRLEVATPSAGEPPRSLRVVLDPSVGLRGRVVDSQGRPLADASVSVRSSGPNPPARFVRQPHQEPDPESNSVSTGRDGFFRFFAVPAAPLDLEVHLKGYAPRFLHRVEMPREGWRDLGALRLVPGLLLTGRIVDPQGAALERSSVFAIQGLSRPAGSAESELLRRAPSAVTGPAGRFRIEDLVEGEPTALFVHRQGYARAWALGLVPGDGRAVDIVLEPTSEVRGTVTTVEGEGVGGAGVRLRRSGRHADAGGVEKREFEHQVTRTAELGAFVFPEVRPGELDLEVDAAGFVPPEPLAVTVLEAGRTIALEVILERGAEIEGHVVSESGKPVAEARLSAQGRLTLSDAEGHFRLTGLRAGTAALEVRHPHYEPFETEVTIAEGLPRMVVTLAEGQLVTGMVAEVDGQPVADASVSLEPVDGQALRRYRALSRADGGFELGPVARGDYRLGAEAEGYPATESAERVSVDGGPVHGLELRLETGGTIRGRVLGASHRLAGVRVEAESSTGQVRQGRLDHEGHYEVTDLALGSWLVTASLDAGRRQARGRARLQREARDAELDLVFEPGLTLSGRVTYDGRPQAATAVSLAGRELGIERSVATDHHGEFTLEDLHPGRYRVALTNARELLVHNELVDLQADRWIDFDLGTADLEGSVADAVTGWPLTGALVAARRVPDDRTPEFLVTSGSGEDGRFALTRVPPGRYRLTVRQDGYAQAEEQLEVAAGVDLRGLDFVLEPTQGLDLRVSLVSGAVPDAIHALVLDGRGRAVVQESRPVDREGRVRLATVPAGSWEVFLQAQGGGSVAIRATVPGEPREVVFPEAARLEVSVPALLESDLVATLQLIGGDGRPLSSLEPGGILRDRWEIVAGLAAIEGVPVGAWTLLAVNQLGATWSGSTRIAGPGSHQVVLE